MPGVSRIDPRSVTQQKASDSASQRGLGERIGGRIGRKLEFGYPPDRRAA